MAKKSTSKTETGSTEVATKTTNEELFGDLKDVLEGQNENVEVTDIQISRIQIGQPLVEEVAVDKPGYEKGCLIDNVSREVLTEKRAEPWLEGKVEESERRMVHCVEVLPLLKLPTEYVKWRDKKERVDGEPPWFLKTLDAHHEEVLAGLWPPKGHWKPEKGAESQRPPVTENMNILVLPIKQDGTALSATVCTFSRTSFRHGRNFVTHLSKHKGQRIPLWGRSYFLYTEMRQEKGSDGTTYTFFEMHAAPGRELADIPQCQLLHMLCHSHYNELTDKTPVDDSGRTKGRVMQEMMINSASLGEDEDHGGSDDVKKRECCGRCNRQ